MAVKSLYSFVIVLALVLSTPAAAVEYDRLHCSPDGTYYGLSLIDWDGDGDMEVVAGNWTPSQAEVWDYDHMLEDMVLIESVPLAFNPWDVDAADLDHDGDIDIVAGIRALGTYAHLNQGTSWTSVHLDWSYCWQTEIADFDGDGHPDIFSGLDYQYIKMFYGDGTGNFAQGPAPIMEHRYGTVTGLNVVDFNFDGRPDLLGPVGFYRHGYAYMRAYPNLSTPGNPAWGTSVGPPEGYPRNMLASTPSVADFDGNGYVDVVTSIDGDPSIFWGYGDGVGLWWVKTLLVDYPEPWSTTFAGDLDQDGDQDVVAGGIDNFTGLRFSWGDGTGNFTYGNYPHEYGMTHRSGLKLGDVNGDGLTDIVTVLYSDGWNDGYDILFRTGPRATLVLIASRIQSIIAADPGAPLADKMEDVLAKVQSAISELEETPPDDLAVVGNIEDAVGDLEAAIDEGLDLDEAEQLMNQLVGTVKQLAVAATNKAIDLGGSEHEIGVAQEALAEGDALRAALEFKDAVGKYKDALDKAEDAIG